MPYNYVVYFQAYLYYTETFPCFIILPVSPSSSQMCVEIDRAKRKQEKLEEYGSDKQQEVLTCIWNVYNGENKVLIHY